MDFESMFPEDTMPSYWGEPDPEADGIPRATERPEQLPSKPRAKKTGHTKVKKSKVAPLPATVQVCGYEITITNTKICWRVDVVHSCGHPAMDSDTSDERYPSRDRPAVVEINRHMRACTEKCKMERVVHTLEGLCETCRQSKHEEDEQASRFGDMQVDDPDFMWNGLD